MNTESDGMHYELHPLCTLFPRMGGAEFDSLVADIKTNGLSQPITLHNGFILDGGNRYRACMEAAIDRAINYAARGLPALAGSGIAASPL